MRSETLSPQPSTSAAGSSMLSDTESSGEPTSIAEKPVSSTRPVKRKAATKSGFEDFFASQLAALNNAEAQLMSSPPDQCTRFGEEVADDIRSIVDPRQQALAMREVREVIFKHKFNTTTSADNNQPNYTQLL